MQDESSDIVSKAFELIEVHALEVACEGVGGALGHPKVFLHIDQEAGRITCPYCSRTYLLKLLASGRRSGH
jgi:uncharacterized Zn-finger protein